MGRRLRVVGRELAAAAAVTRADPSAEAGPRAVRLAAVGLGLLLLLGAIATFVVLTAVAGPPTEAPQPAATHGAAASQSGAWSLGRR